MLHPTHAQLLDAVNHARTEAEHREAEARLHGWRDGWRDAGRHLDLCEADWYYLSPEDTGTDRPMCCGVWLDWKPAPVSDGDEQNSCPVGPGDIGAEHGRRTTHPSSRGLGPATRTPGHPLLDSKTPAAGEEAGRGCPGDPDDRQGCACGEDGCVTCPDWIGPPDDLDDEAPDAGEGVK